MCKDDPHLSPMTDGSGLLPLVLWCCACSEAVRPALCSPFCSRGWNVLIRHHHCPFLGMDHVLGVKLEQQVPALVSQYSMCDQDS